MVDGDDDAAAGNNEDDNDNDVAHGNNKEANCNDNGDNDASTPFGPLSC